MPTRRSLMVAIGLLVSLGLVGPPRADAGDQHRYRLHVRGMT